MNIEGMISRKYDCPFRMCGYFEKNRNDWWLAMLNGVHHHELEPKLGGHLLAGRIKEDEKKRVLDISTSLVLPMIILTNLKKLEEHKYVYFARTNYKETTLKDIFFADPKSINMLNTFPTVLVMDATYKTNMYRMPLFEIVGGTSTNMTYYVGFGFIASKIEGNFTWVLEMLVGFFSPQKSTCLRWLSLKGTLLG